MSQCRVHLGVDLHTWDWQKVSTLVRAGRQKVRFHSKGQREQYGLVMGTRIRVLCALPPSEQHLEAFSLPLKLQDVVSYLWGQSQWMHQII